MAAEVVNQMQAGVASFCVESGPGTGKSYLIRKVAAIDEQPVLVLAYNRMLKEHLEKTLPLNAECVTFHGLCGRYLGVARDDDQLCEAVERGEATPRCEASVKYARVCIDEAQDVRPVYGTISAVIVFWVRSFSSLCSGLAAPLLLALLPRPGPPPPHHPLLPHLLSN
jgi:hypothetical protein